MKIAFLSESKNNIKKVYGEDSLDFLKKFELLDEVVNKKNIESYKEFLANTEYIFSTWGMARFSAEEIKKYFPALKGLFYAAGSVQGFAKEFLDCGIPVYSAWQANAIPVAEYTFAQIILAGKRFYQSARLTKKITALAYLDKEKMVGNYKLKVGIIGAGQIGALVCERLRNIDCEVFAYDKFLTQNRAAELGIQLVDIEDLFAKCDIISNHLADKDELVGFLNGNLFAKMKSNATFINTGRGRQVVEKDLIKEMRKFKNRLSLLDVTSPEPMRLWSGLRRTKNIIVTSHIAGSYGNEVWRMADFMIAEFDRVLNNKKAEFEVSLQMLTTMA